jgi:hypothetical protein
MASRNRVSERDHAYRYDGRLRRFIFFILGRFRPMTISVFADLFLMLPALPPFLP